MVFLVDANAAVPKDLPKPKRVRVGSERHEYVFITQRATCMAQEVDEARIAANGLEVLQVGSPLSTHTNRQNDIHRLRTCSSSIISP